MKRHSLLLLFLLALTGAAQAQFNYTITNSQVTITGYSGPGGTVTIPSTITGLPVTSIGSNAFYSNHSLTSVTIPNSVTNIGQAAFYSCTNLTGITVEDSNPNYGSLDGVVFDKTQTTLIQFPGGKSGAYTMPNSVTTIGILAFGGGESLTSVTLGSGVTAIGEGAFTFCTSLTSVAIPNSVTTIGNGAFFGCTSLTSVTIPTSVISIGYATFANCVSLTTVTIPNSVTTIEDSAFASCTKLTVACFKGKPPAVKSTAFDGDAKAVVYYLPGTTGWTTTFAGRPTKLWNPAAPIADAKFGVQAGQFGFTIKGTSGLIVVVEAYEDLSNPLWTSVKTLTLANGTGYFSDPDWAGHPSRFYRFRSL